MDASRSERLGLLVIRARLEGDGRLIARITQTPDVERQHSTVSVTGSSEEVCSTVRAWLQELRIPPAAEPGNDPST
jgi:hypothetical protein